MLLLWGVQTLAVAFLRGGLKQALILIFLCPLFVVIQILNWLFLLLDALLINTWQKVEIVKPIFVSGVPRSGTTFLHRTLSKDKQLTTTKTWELIFAPSLIQKFIWFYLGKLFSFKKMSWLSESAFLKNMSAVHELGLNEPEEDFLFFLPMNACFILVSIFPESKGLWQLTRFDAEMKAWEKSLIMGFYRSCVQKHLYFKRYTESSSELTYLSKNPSFTPMLNSLAKEFPDGRFLLCAREPGKTVPSQISSLMPAFKLLGIKLDQNIFNQLCMTMLKHYYDCVQYFLATQEQALLIRQDDLKNNLETVLTQCWEKFNLQKHEQFSHSVSVHAKESKSHTSQHKYSLEEFGLSQEIVESYFTGAWDGLKHY